MVMSMKCQDFCSRTYSNKKPIKSEVCSDWLNKCIVFWLASQNLTGWVLMTSLQIRHHGIDMGIHFHSPYYLKELQHAASWFPLKPKACWLLMEGFFNKVCFPYDLWANSLPVHAVFLLKSPNEWYFQIESPHEWYFKFDRQVLAVLVKNFWLNQSVWETYNIEVLLAPWSRHRTRVDDTANLYLNL